MWIGIKHKNNKRANKTLLYRSINYLLYIKNYSYIAGVRIINYLIDDPYANYERHTLL